MVGHGIFAQRRALLAFTSINKMSLLYKQEARRTAADRKRAVSGRTRILMQQHEAKATNVSAHAKMKPAAGTGRSQVPKTGAFVCSLSMSSHLHGRH